MSSEEIIYVQVGSNELDNVIHDPMGLNILLYLYVVEKADFIYLLHHTGQKGAALRTYLGKLEELGFVERTSETVNRKQNSLYKLSRSGREAFDKYRDMILNLMQAGNPPGR